MPEVPSSLYAPPRATVEDRQPETAPLERPPRMTTALVCVGLDYALAVLGVAIVLAWTPLPASVLEIMGVGSVVVLGLMLLVNIKLAHGRNWARWAYIVLGALGVLNDLNNLLRYARGGTGLPMLMPLIYVATIGLELYVIGVLFTAPVRAWYHAMKER